MTASARKAVRTSDTPMFRASSIVFLPLIEDHGIRRVRRYIEVEVDGHRIRAALVATLSRAVTGRRGATSFFAYVQKKERDLTKTTPPNGMPEIQCRKHLVKSCWA